MGRSRAGPFQAPIPTKGTGHAPREAACASRVGSGRAWRNAMPQDRIEPSASLSRFVEGLALHAESLRLLLAHRSLWGPALVPLLLSVLALIGTLGFVVSEAGWLYGLVTGWMPALAADTWAEWLWVGPARAGLLLLGGVLFVVAAGIVLVLALAVAGVLAAPFLDVLAARVERLLTGSVVDLSPGGLRGAVAGGLRAAREESVRALFFLALQGALLLGGLLLPGGQLLAPAVMTALTVLFLPLDTASYTLDRRRFSFAAKRRFVLDRKALMAGFGIGAFGVHLVPGLNFLAMPVLVVGGTLLALRHAPPPEALASGPGPGAPEFAVAGSGPDPEARAPEREAGGVTPGGVGPPPGRARAPGPGSATSP